MSILLALGWIVAAVAIISAVMITVAVMDGEVNRK